MALARRPRAGRLGTWASLVILAGAALLLPGPGRTRAAASAETVERDGLVDVRALRAGTAADRDAALGPPRRRRPGRATRPAARPDGDAAGLAATVRQEAAPPGADAIAPGPSVAVAQVGFAGLQRSAAGGFTPPDTQVAAGPDHVFEVVNVAGRIFTKSGAALATFPLEELFGLPPSAFLFDPRLRFDVLSGRWFVSAVTDDGTTGRWHLAVSASSDPLGPFAIYRFETPGSLPDFPALGIGSDKVVLTGNAFSCVPTCLEGVDFQGSEFLVFNKAQLLAGQATVDTAFFPPDQGQFSIQPAHALSATTILPMAAVDFPSASTIRLWQLSGVPGVGPGVAATAVDRPIRLLATPPGASQLDGAVLLDTGDNRLLDAVYRDGRLWVAANGRCRPAGDALDRACLRLIELDTATVTVTQDFDFGAAATHAFYPAIHLDAAGSLVVVYSRSSAVEFGSVYATGRFASDPPDRLQAPTLLKAGEAPYAPGNPTLNRWGDYSGASVDPADPSTVWVAGEYMRAEGGIEWGTWIARVRLEVSGFAGGVFVAAGDLDGSGAAQIVTGPGPGGEPRILTFRVTGTGPATGPLLDVLAYPASFRGGVRVTTCDLTGDGRAEIVTAPGPGLGPLLRAFDGATGAFLGELAVGPETYTGGVFVACADVTGDGIPELLASTDAGVLPAVVLWRLAPGPPARGVGLAFEESFTGGVRIAACDLDGDGRADLVAGAGPGGTPRVRVFDGATGALASEFLAFEPGFTGGVFVACGPAGPGGAPAIVVGRGTGAPPEVRVYGPDGAPTGVTFDAYAPGFGGGVRVAVGSLDGPGPAEILTGAGPGGGPHVRAFTGLGAPLDVSVFPY